MEETFSGSRRLKDEILGNWSLVGALYLPR